MADDKLVLTEDGYLAPGIHTVTIDEFEAYFAQTIPDVEKRQALFNGYRQFCDILGSMFGIHNYTQWIGGSFTTEKKEPSDIDVVTVIDFDEPCNINDSNINMFNLITSSPKSKDLFHCDSYKVAAFPLGHEKYDWYINNRKAYWVDLWGHTRNDITGHRKDRGFLRIIHGRGAKYE